MSQPKSITIVVARAINGAIGLNNDLPWHLPGDLKHFKDVTMGTTMIMGRKTFESLPGVLPGRRHIVLTRDEDWYRDGVEVAHSKEGALELANGDEVTVIGGEAIFAMFHDDAGKIELTEVLAEVEGDTFMDDPRSTGEWHEVACKDHPAVGDRPAYRFTTLLKGHY